MIIFFLILCCQCFSRLVNEYHRKRQLRLAKQKLLQSDDKIPYATGACVLHNLDQYQPNSFQQNPFHPTTSSNGFTKSKNQTFVPTSDLCERVIKRSHTLGECEWQHEMAGASVTAVAGNIPTGDGSFSTTQPDPKMSRCSQDKSNILQSNSKVRLKNLARASTMHSFKSLPPPPYIRNINAVEHI